MLVFLIVLQCSIKSTKVCLDEEGQKVGGAIKWLRRERRDLMDFFLVVFAFLKRSWKRCVTKLWKALKAVGADDMRERGKRIEGTGSEERD
jgi:hypothetical protein